MITEVYKYRSVHGIVTYEVISGEFGVDSILHLRDTSCKHPGDKCEISVVKCADGNGYTFLNALNDSAKEYIYFHQTEIARFWATKKEACVEMLQTLVKWNYDSITDSERRIKESREELNSYQVEEIHYFTPAMAKETNRCYVENEGWCNIIGHILFNDGTTGYLTGDQYSDSSDGYESDRIILLYNKAEERLKTERGDSVFVSDFDYENNKTNKRMARHESNIERYEGAIKKNTMQIERYNTIIGMSDDLTYEQIRDMVNSVE